MHETANSGYLALVITTITASEVISTISMVLPGNSIELQYPPKLFEDDRRAFLNASSLPRYRLPPFRVPFWTASSHGYRMLREIRILSRAITNPMFEISQIILRKNKEDRAKVIVGDLRRTIFHGNVSQMDEKLRSTSSRLLGLSVVATYAAYFYLECGHFRAARAIIDASVLSFATTQTEWIYREDVTVLALISCYINIHIFLDFEKALLFLEQVEAVFVRLDCKIKIANACCG